ncbi:MAG: HipA domain-containing protein [Kiritimatiellae bacterium]|nr:HipA domain-containing protein [Kiritimatiellia bacterium]
METALLRRLQNVFALLNPEKDAGDFKVIIVFYFKIGPSCSSAKKELFRRSALNVFAHNRDDHLKNSGFLMDANGVWTLEPFYNFTYAESSNGWHALSSASIIHEN